MTKLDDEKFAELIGAGDLNTLFDETRRDPANAARFRQWMNAGLSEEPETMAVFREKSPCFAAMIDTIGFCHRLMNFAKNHQPEQMIHHLFLEGDGEQNMQLIKEAMAYLSAVVEAVVKEAKSKLS